MPIKFLPSAPNRLVQAYESREIGKGRKLLELLLTSEQMTPAWKYLTKRVDEDKQWLRVWSAIAWAKQKAGNKGRAPELRTEERDRYLSMASIAQDLANRIEGGPDDVLVYELFPADTLFSFGIKEWPKDPFARLDKASEKIPAWPSASELLAAMASMARQKADDAMTRPRPDATGGDSVAERTFIFELGGRFKEIFGDKLSGTIATITEVVYGSEVTVDRVKQVLRRGYKTEVNKASVL